MNDTTEIILGPQQATDAKMLVAPSRRKLGGGPAEIEHGRIAIRVGNRPIVRNLRLLYEKSGKAVPADLDVFMSYELWLITFTFSIMPSTWVREVTRVGFEVRFPDSPRVTIISVVPDTRFVTTIDGSLKGAVDLELSGRASVPSEKVTSLRMEEQLPFGGKVEISGEAKLAARITLAIITPTIMATGEADTRAEWAFLKEDRQLAGSQEMAVTLLVPRNVESLKAKLRVCANIATFSFLPTRLAGPWVDVDLVP